MDTEYLVPDALVGDNVKALVRWATGKRLTYRLPKLSLTTLSPWSGGMSRSRPDTRVDVSPTRGFNSWGPRESIYQILDMRKLTFLQQTSVFMVVVRFDFTTSSSSPSTTPYVRAIVRWANDRRLTIRL